MQDKISFKDDPVAYRQALAKAIEWKEGGYWKGSKTQSKKLKIIVDSLIPTEIIREF